MKFADKPKILKRLHPLKGGLQMWTTIHREVTMKLVCLFLALSGKRKTNKQTKTFLRIYSDRTICWVLDSNLYPGSRNVQAKGLILKAVLDRGCPWDETMSNSSGPMQDSHNN